MAGAPVKRSGIASVGRLRPRQVRSIADGGVIEPAIRCYSRVLTLGGALFLHGSRISHHRPRDAVRSGSTRARSLPRVDGQTPSTEGDAGGRLCSKCRMSGRL